MGRGGIPTKRTACLNVESQGCWRKKLASRGWGNGEMRGVGNGEWWDWRNALSLLLVGGRRKWHAVVLVSPVFYLHRCVVSWTPPLPVPLCSFRRTLRLTSSFSKWVHTVCLISGALQPHTMNHSWTLANGVQILKVPYMNIQGRTPGSHCCNAAPCPSSSVSLLGMGAKLHLFFKEKKNLFCPSWPPMSQPKNLLEDVCPDEHMQTNTSF